MFLTFSQDFLNILRFWSFWDSFSYKYFSYKKNRVIVPIINRPIFTVPEWKLGHYVNSLSKLWKFTKLFIRCTVETHKLPYIPPLTFRVKEETKEVKWEVTYLCHFSKCCQISSHKFSTISMLCFSKMISSKNRSHQSTCF